MHHSLAELDTHRSSQPWVSKVAAEIVQFWCCCCIFSFSSFLLWPLVMSGWTQRGREWEWEPGPHRLLTSPWIQRPSDNILVDTVGWGCTRLLGKGELLQFPLLPPYFQHTEPWASRASPLRRQLLQLADSSLIPKPPAGKWHVVLPFLCTVRNVIRIQILRQDVSKIRGILGFSGAEEVSRHYQLLPCMCLWLPHMAQILRSGLLKKFAFFSVRKKHPDWQRCTPSSSPLWFKRAKL